MLTTTMRDRAVELLAVTETGLEEVLRTETARWRAADPSSADVPATLARFVRNGGKRLRPAFCTWGYLGAVGDNDPGSRDSAVVAVAIALELLHAFALVHDDVMDGSATRRGAPSVHAEFGATHVRTSAAGEARRFGEGIAILVGDLAHVLAERVMAPAPTAVRASWHEMQLELTRGQALDMVAAAQRCVDPVVARRIAILKSGRYTVVRPLVLGALAAGRPDLTAAYIAFGEPLGEAFQLRDDLIGAFGESSETGKPVGDDLREGKPTLLLASAHERVRGGRALKLLQRAGADDITDAEVRAMQRLLVDCGAASAVERRLDDLTSDAFDALDRTAVPIGARAGLRDLAVAAVWRQS